eukprot:gene53978-816_t
MPAHGSLPPPSPALDALPPPSPAASPETGSAALACGGGWGRESHGPLPSSIAAGGEEEPFSFFASGHGSDDGGSPNKDNTGAAGAASPHD